MISVVWRKTQQGKSMEVGSDDRVGYRFMWNGQRNLREMFLN